MGRTSRTAITTREASRLTLQSLLRQGIIKRGYGVEVPEYTWSRNGQRVRSVRLETLYTSTEAWVKVEYVRTDTTTGTREHVEQIIELDRAPSNLGRGEVLYFLCPRTGRRCRVLYMAYGGKYFLSREAYPQRIYYPTQVSSRYDLQNDRFWNLDRKVDALEGKRQPGTYRGRPTKRALRMERTWQKRAEADAARMSLASLPLSLRRPIEESLREWILTR